MVKIRLSRAGARNRPYYHVVVVDERRKRDGRPLAVVGSFDPKTKPERIALSTQNDWSSRIRKLMEQIECRLSPSARSS